ncbi:MFS transporter [Alteromonas sp. KUL42]|uniref:MFS transporter n=1 Tax=Alteromonas sp. KUL42 TaxID=2480797 RepID=UPI0010366492|nr:MFS transporter [Alteromonas sp. KUL42]TAP34429.1 MFS transporter [Alteromonas sp. KUL42]GEA07836.1 MFS transporter [Alteromonas sp. KUL42]
MTSNKKHRLIAGLTFNKLADLLISVKTTLTALFIMIGAPAWMIGWLVPIRESGALLPQALLGVYLRRHSARHVVWRTGMCVQFFSVFLTFFSVLVFEGKFLAEVNSKGAWVGGMILVALMCLSLGRAACSLTVKDIEASVAKKGERGNLIGLASTASGLVTLLIALPLYIFNDALNLYFVAGIVGFSALAFFVSLVVIWPIETYVDVSEHQSKGIKLHVDTTVYKFILVRGIFVHSALVAPYFLLQKEADVQDYLPIYIAAEALASLLSSLIWGAVADKSAKLTLQIAGGLALVACLGLLLIQSEHVVVSAVLFFILAVAHAGVRTGRKTYSLDIKEGHDRTMLVGLSNTAIGIILLAFGGFYALLTPMLSFSVVYIMSAMLAIGIVSTALLPNEKA